MTMNLSPRVLFVMAICVVLVTACGGGASLTPTNPFSVQAPAANPPGLGGTAERPAEVPGDAAAAFDAWLIGDLDEVVTYFSAKPDQTPLDYVGYAELALQRGYYHDALSRYADLLEAHPGDPHAGLAALRLWQYREYVGPYEEIAKRAVTGTKWEALPLYARVPLAKVAQAVVGEAWPSSPPSSVSLGQPEQWRRVGPFSYREVAAFDAPFAPEKDAVLAESYQYLGREIERVEEGVASVWSLTGVYYLETFIEVSEPLEVLVSLRSGSGVRLWVDEHLAIDRSLSQGYPPIELARRVMLDPGRHRLRVKLGVGGANAAFELQVIPTEDALPTKKITDAEPGETAPSTLKEAVALRGGVADDLASASPLDWWMAAVWAEESGEFERGLEATRALKDQFERFTLPHTVDAELLRQDSAFDPTQGLEGALEDYRRVLALDPRAMQAQLMLGFLLFREEQFEAALEAFDDVIRRTPHELIGHFYRHQVLSELGWESLAEGALASAFALRPHSCGLAQMLYGYRSSAQRFATPEQVPEALRGCPEIQALLVNNHYLPRGDFERAIALSKSSGMDMEEQAAVLAGAGDRAGAVELLEDAEGRNAAIQRADLLLSEGLNREAAVVLDDALAELPTELSLIELARFFGGERVLEDLRIDGLAFVQDYLKDEKGYNLAGFYLLDYAAFRYYSDGSSLVVTHQISQVLNKQGIEILGEVHIPPGAIVTQLRTIKADGVTTVKPESIPNKTGISMPSLDVGDFIEVEYINAASAKGEKDGRFIVPRWYFQITDAPLIHSEVVYDLPEDVEPMVDVRGNVPAPEITQVGAFKRYRYLMTEMLPPRKEPGAPAPLETTPSIQLAHGFDVEALRMNYRNQLLKRVRPSVYLQAALALALGEMEPPKSLRAQVEHLYHFVLRETEQSSGNFLGARASWIWTSGQGSPLTLLKALLDLAEIKAEVVLVKPRGMPEPDSKVPDLRFYSRAVLRVEADGEVLWLDPSSEFSPFNYLAPSFHGRPSLSLSAEGERETLPMYDAEIERQLARFEMRLTPEGDLEGRGVETSDGTRGVGLRNLVKQISGDPNKVQQVLQQYLTPFFRAVEVTTHKFGDIKEKGPFAVEYEFKSSGFSTTTKEGLSVNAVIYNEALTQSLAGLGERQQPLVLNVPRRNEVELRFALPEGWSLVEAPRSSSIQSDFGSFSREVSIEGQTLTLTDRLDVEAQRISPERYPNFRAFAQSVDDAQVIQFELLPKKRRR